MVVAAQAPRGHSPSTPSSAPWRRLARLPRGAMRHGLCTSTARRTGSTPPAWQSASKRCHPARTALARTLPDSAWGGCAGSSWALRRRSWFTVAGTFSPTTTPPSRPSPPSFACPLRAAIRVAGRQHSDGPWPPSAFSFRGVGNQDASRRPFG